MRFEYKEIPNGFLADINYSKQKLSSKDDTKDRRKIIVEILKQHKNISIDEIVEIVEISRSTVIRDIEKLKTENKIKRLGGRKTGEWKVIR